MKQNRQRPRKKRHLFLKFFLILVGLICVLFAAWLWTPPLVYKSSGTEHFDQSEKAQFIVSRADELASVSWTPLYDLTGWKDSYTYKAGKTYQGIPYGQPTDAAYVGFDATLDEFCTAVDDPNSLMYTHNAQAMGVAPYYSTDCSAFVSYCWNLPSRQTTWTIPEFAELISTTSYADAEIGDCLDNPHKHVVLITDIERNEAGTIVGLELTQATAPGLISPDGTVVQTRYGKGTWRSLYELELFYFRDGYSLYRPY